MSYRPTEPDTGSDKEKMSDTNVLYQSPGHPDKTPYNHAVTPRSFGNPIRLGPIVSGTQEVVLSPDQRSTHLHIVGNTGSGKTKLIEHLVRQDILANRGSKCGLLLIDPHGSLYDSIMSWLAFKGIDRPITPINLRRDEWIVAYNLLRKRKSANASVVVDAIVDAMAHAWGTANTDQTPRFARWASNLLHVLYEKGYTLADAVHLLTSQVELRDAMVAGITDDMARRDWEMVRSFKPREFEDEVSSTVNRLRRFISNKHMQAIFGQTTKSFDFGPALDEGHIVLVNLSQEGGIISEENARLYGTLLLNDLWTAAKERGKRDDVKPFYVYVDEFQKFLTPTIADNLDQSRGFGIHWTLSHQFPAQLRDAGENGKRVYNSVMENARSKVVFSLATKDNLQPMAEWLFTGTLNPDQIKHELHSTKVLNYREEYRKAYTHGKTSSTGGTHHSSYSAGEGSGSSSSFDADANPTGEVESWNSYFASAEGATESWSESKTETTTDVPSLIPVMGKELASVQFRSLDEQLFRAMAVLFDQEQRQCVVRLRGMRAPVSLFTPYIERVFIRSERVEKYERAIYNRLPFALRTTEAQALIQSHNSTFLTRAVNEAKVLAESDEPTTARRRLR